MIRHLWYIKDVLHFSIRVQAATKCDSCCNAPAVALTSLLCLIFNFFLSVWLEMDSMYNYFWNKSSYNHPYFLLITNSRIIIIRQRCTKSVKELGYFVCSDTNKMRSIITWMMIKVLNDPLTEYIYRNGKGPFSIHS